jgi:hypothetical protein
VLRLQPAWPLGQRLPQSVGGVVFNKLGEGGHMASGGSEGWGLREGHWRGSFCPAPACISDQLGG